MPLNTAAAASCFEAQLMRLLIVVLSVLVALLQYRAWFGDVGYFAAQKLQAEVAEQRRRGVELAERNQSMVDFSFRCGMRVKEIAALELKDVVGANGKLKKSFSNSARACLRQARTRSSLEPKWL